MANTKYISSGAPNAAIEDRSVDTIRPLRIICIGAGISGIITAIRFPQRLKNIELVIYEKNRDVSGTWLENRYPGCACGMVLRSKCKKDEATNESSDIPAHTYQLSFEPNKEWSQFYASAKEIHQYWKNVVKKYNCDQYFRLDKKVVEARWIASQAIWMLKVGTLWSEGHSENRPNTFSVDRGCCHWDCL